jgi:hypothetical protein
MRQFFLIFALILSNSGNGQLVHPANNEGFLQDEVASIFIALPPTELDLLLGLEKSRLILILISLLLVKNSLILII